MSFNLAHAILADAAYEVAAEDLQHPKHPISSRSRPWLLSLTNPP